MKELLLKKRNRFILYVVACFFPIAIDLIRNFLMSHIFGAIEQQNLERFLFLIYLGLGFLALEFTSLISSRLMRISYMRDTILDVRIAAFDKILNSSYKHFSKKSKDTYISNLINDINQFENNFFLSLINFIYRSGIYIGSMIIIFFIDYYLALAMIVVSIGIFFMTKTFQKKTTSLQEKVSDDNENFTTQTANIFNGLEILKLNNLEDKFTNKSFDSIDKIERSKFRFRFFSDTQRSVTYFVGFGCSVAVLLYLLGTYNTFSRNYQEVMLLILLANNMAFALQDIFPRLNVIRASAHIYEKITKQEKETYTNGKTNPFTFNDKVEIKDLSFSLGGKQIFNNANCIIEKNKKYLIKGASGIGKSTLIKLLSFIYEDYTGTITIDDVDLRSIKEKSFHENVAYIYQDVFLFEDSLKNNITLFKEIDTQSINHAIKQSGLTSFLEKNPEGIDTKILENGKNLSGGERQRVSIARAIAKHAQILFVDEGTSALNEELGSEVEKTFTELDCTVLSISHRYYKGISEQYDYVLELKNGKITTYPSKDYFQEEAHYV